MMKNRGTVLFSILALAAAALMTAASAGCGRKATGPGADTAAAGPAAMSFGYPVEGEPWYHVKGAFVVPDIPAGTEKRPWSVDRVAVDGVRVRDFQVFQGGREIDKHRVKAAGGRIAVEIKARSVWRPGAEAALKIDLVEPESGELKTAETAGTAPAGRGYWDPAWKSYLALTVSEEHGFDRTGYPVHATLGVLADRLGSPDEVRVVRAERAGADVAYKEVPSQVYDLVTWNDPRILATEERDAVTGEKVVRYHPTTTFSLAFLADVAAGKKATYLVFTNNPGAPRPAYATDLAVTAGPGLARTVENGFYRIALHEKSGVIDGIVEKTTGITLEHKLETNGAVHWNPDVYAPPHAWYHTSDWTAPEDREIVGPVFYSRNLRDRLPQPEGVEAAIRYHFYAGSPVVMVESVTRVAQDTFVQALRGAEVVFNHEVFTKAAFKRDGRTEVLDFAASKMHPAHAAVLRPDTPWVSFFDEEKGVGFASLFLDLATPNLNGGQASLQQPFIYIQHGLWFYVSRGLVYSFGTNNQTRMLPVAAGSVYYDRNAWIAFPCPKVEALGGWLDARWNALKWPLAVRDDIETYAESPEGWVVPILTEPFEEGVRGAKGGRDRRK